MELIQLPIPLGTRIVKLLKEKNIEPRIYESGPKKGLLSLEFTQEELDSITKLEIKNQGIGELEGIEYLRNLEVLSVSNTGDTAYEKSPSSITDKDIKKISTLKNLKSLTIDNQSNISWLVLDDLQNLEELCITRNSNLEDIYGLEKLLKLKSFEERGNKSLYVVDGIQTMIRNNDLDVFETDVLHYPEVISEMQKLVNMVNCSFSEQLWESQHHSVSYSFYQMMLFHQKCLEIAQLAKESSMDRRTQILFVEKYLAENITYDYDALKLHNRTHFDDGVQRGKKNGTNSAYNGIMYGSAVCEGYTRSMQYILKLMGIKTKNVYCISGKDKIRIDESYHNQVSLPDDGYHSIIRIDDNYGIYYFDPCWDSCYWHEGDKTLPYAFLTKNEMSKDHTFSFEEDGILFDMRIPRKNIEYAIEVLDEKDNSIHHNK